MREGSNCSSSADWVCCQIGAREHYSIPRALFRRGRLRALITEYWAEPNSSLSRIGGSRLQGRHHPDLEKAEVESFNWHTVAFEGLRARHLGGWDRISARNEWFQRRAMGVLQRIQRDEDNRSLVLFSFSYAAGRLFEFAKSKGWRTVLGQIDPGPMEERIVARLHEEAPATGSDWRPAPPGYWESWKRECDLSDAILVNSEWSRAALQEEGISASKLHLVPLVYEASHENSLRPARAQMSFNEERPLRVLFLGQVNLRKGMGVILKALPQLLELPVELTVAGPLQVAIPAGLRNHPRVRWLGSVPRSAAASLYESADIFLFPTFSDGFGITQLEAQAARLPVIASRCCGEVIKHLENGYVLDEITAEAVTASIRFLVQNPAVLARLAANSRVAPGFSLQRLEQDLCLVA